MERDNYPHGDDGQWYGYGNVHREGSQGTRIKFADIHSEYSLINHELDCTHAGEDTRTAMNDAGRKTIVR